MISIKGNDTSKYVTYLLCLKKITHVHLILTYESIMIVSFIILCTDFYHLKMCLPYSQLLEGVICCICFHQANRKCNLSPDHTLKLPPKPVMQQVLRNNSTNFGLVLEYKYQNQPLLIVVISIVEAILGVEAIN